MSGLFPVLAKMAAELLDRELQVLADSPRADSEGGGNLLLLHALNP